LLRAALGYAVRQRAAMTRFFDDGRLRLTTNEAERELRGGSPPGARPGCSSAARIMARPPATC